MRRLFVVLLVLCFGVAFGQPKKRSLLVGSDTTTKAPLGYYGLAVVNKAAYLIGNTGPAIQLMSYGSLGQIEQSNVRNLNDSLGSRLKSSLAAATYATKSGATFSGTVSLPSETSIGLVSPTDIIRVKSLGYSNEESIDSTYSLASWGDSFTAGAGAVPPTLYSYPARLGILSGLQVFNGGIGGETSTQIKTRFLADSLKWKYPQIFWVGRNNLNSATIIADLNAMIAKLPHTKYIILTIMNSSTETIGTANYNTVIAINNNLKSTYGSKVVDIRDYLLQNSDLTDRNNGIISARLRSDVLHLNAVGYDLVARKLYVDVQNLLYDDIGVVSNFLLNDKFKKPLIIGSTTPNVGNFSKIGIGKKNPVELLDIDGGSGIAKLKLDLNSSNLGLKLYAANGTNFNPFYLRVKGNDSGKLWFGAGSAADVGSETITDYMVLTPGGHLGLGNSYTPTTQFGIRSSGTGETEVLRIEKATTGGGDGIRLGFSHFASPSVRSAEIYIGRTSGGYQSAFYFRTNTGSSPTDIANRLVIGPDGSVYIHQGGITETSPASSALTVNSNTKGFLPPRMTSTQRDLIPSLVAGLVVFCTDCTATDTSTGVLQIYNGSVWKNAY